MAGEFAERPGQENPGGAPGGVRSAVASAIDKDGALLSQRQVCFRRRFGK